MDTKYFKYLAASLPLMAELSTFHKEEKQKVTKSKKQLSYTYDQPKQGQKVFEFEDGFTCEALNQKSANKKHERWIKEKKQ